MPLRSAAITFGASRSHLYAALPSTGACPLQQSFLSRSFSASTLRPSYIGRSPITVPTDCHVEFRQPKISAAKARLSRTQAARPVVQVSGPLGKLNMEVPPYLTVAFDPASRKAALSVFDPTEKKQKAMWGTTRAYLQNNLLGVSEGHVCILRLVGVGYRATIETTAITKSPEYDGQSFVSLKVGYSHPIELAIPLGVTASTPQPTRILLESIDKEIVTQFAAKIRQWRVPEPYKGKGIFVNDETIRMKSKRIK